VKQARNQSQIFNRKSIHATNPTEKLELLFIFCKYRQVTSFHKDDAVASISRILIGNQFRVTYPEI